MKADDKQRSTRDERLTRLLDGADATQDDPRSILYSHTVLCQTCLPYRNPGDEVREWEQANNKTDNINASRHERT